MSMNKGTLNEINRVAAEVVELVQVALREIEGATSWEQDEATGRYYDVPKYLFPNVAPDSERHPMRTKTSATLRRRSMDLTRLLAEMRRAQ